MTNDMTRVQMKVELRPAIAVPREDYAMEVREAVGLEGGMVNVQAITYEIETEEYGIGRKRASFSKADEYTIVECVYYPEIDEDDREP